MSTGVPQPDDPPRDPQDEIHSEPRGALNRRQLLKGLAAVLGAAALSSVPDRWKTPVIEVGELPAHAQGLSGETAPIISHGTQTFSSGTSSFVVPTGITSLTIEASGAEGGNGAGFSSLAPKRSPSVPLRPAATGRGGYVKATVAVTEGETLTVVAGGIGADGLGSDGTNEGPGGAGGSQGGTTTGGDGGTSPAAAGGGGGGGSSYVLRGPSTFLVVAGGGGGSGGMGSTSGLGGSGGSGGGTTGGNGTPASGNAGAGGGSSLGGTAGIGGSAGVGPAGTGGIDGGTSSSGNPGQGGDGGAGSAGISSQDYPYTEDTGGAGGGGGGGWTGGGGGGGGGGDGGAGGGGGGGSSYTDPAATGITHTQGAKSGSGVVVLTW